MSEERGLFVGLAWAGVEPPTRTLSSSMATGGPSVGRHDPPFATAIVPDDGERSGVAIASDLIGEMSQPSQMSPAAAGVIANRCTELLGRLVGEGCRGN